MRVFLIFFKLRGSAEVLDDDDASLRRRRVRPSYVGNDGAKPIYMEFMGG